MTKYIILFILLAGSLNLQAQTDTVPPKTRAGDSLLAAIEREPDAGKRFDMTFLLLGYGTDSDPIYTLEMGKKLQEMGRKKNDPSLEANGWGYYGQGYRLTANYPKALECHYKAIELATRAGRPALLAQSYNQIAHIYKDREDNEKALSLYHTALMYSKQDTIPLMQVWPCMNLGNVYLNMGILDSAVYYSRIGLQNIRKQGNFYTKYVYIPNMLGNLASAFGKMGKNAEALQAFREALSLVNDPGYSSLRQKQLLYYRMAEYFRQTGPPDSCLYYARKAIELVENTVYSYLNTRPAMLLSGWYEGKNADSTVKYLRLYLKTNEIINNTRTTQQLQMLSVEAEQRKNELEQAKKDDRARLQKNLLIGGILFGFLLAGFFLRNANRRKKDHQRIQKAYTELRETQQQLIQSEKMASLGELTAGIAHEIQNPLNFVNNFSELNTELIDELKQELATGNLQSAKELADNIRDNEEKIAHHGKRADGIVKGMLQHSRSSSGQKEPTDINALCDEYLRLAYHGLRAKDKSFNAKFETDLDPAVGLVSVMPQEIGRVILNLINNAFYAVNERKKTADPGYEPCVTVSTRKTAGKVEIEVRDNGTGIPQKAIDKIFQPFFTTKPTGEGTGLGLSLSYDIVTKGHGGELNVNTVPGEGTAFIIRL